MLKLRRIGIDDYSVFEDKRRIGRIRFASERTPPIWLWTTNIHLTGGLPMGSSPDLDTAKTEFKAAWEELKARVSREQLAAAFADMNIREGDGGFTRKRRTRSPGKSLRPPGTRRRYRRAYSELRGPSSWFILSRYSP